MIDAERKSNLKKVLSDAVPMLCLSGLGVHHSEVAVEALIGITINNNEVVLISFNELMTADGSAVSHTWCQLDSHKNNSQPSDCSKNRLDLKSSIDLSDAITKTNADVNDDTVDTEVLSRYDGMDGSGMSCVKSAEWNSTETDWRSSPKSAIKPWRRKNKVCGKNLVEVNQQVTLRKRIAEDLSASTADGSEGIIARDLAKYSPDSKVEQNGSENCIFVKVENSDDDFELSCAVMDVSNLDCNYSASGKKKPRCQTTVENYDLFRRAKLFTNSMVKTCPRTAATHVRLKHSRGRELDNLAQAHIDQNLPVIDFPGNQSDASMLTSSETLLPFPLDQHHPELIPPTASQFAPKKRCRVCYARKVRKEVRFCCSACPDLPGLCLNPCFYEYHQVFMSPRFLQQGTTSENIRQDNYSSVEGSHSKPLLMTNLSVTTDN